MSTQTTLEKRKSAFGKSFLGGRKLASRTSHPVMTVFHYTNQNFGIPTNLRPTEASDLMQTENIVLEEEMLSMRVSKSLDQTASTWEVRLTPSQNWKQKISPGDWVIINMFDDGIRSKMNKDEITNQNLILLGNVDRVARDLSREENGDAVKLTYVVAGRGFGKAIEDTDIWFDPFTTQVDTLNNVALVTAGLPLYGRPDDLVNDLIDALIGPGANIGDYQIPDLNTWKIPSAIGMAFQKRFSAAAGLAAATFSVGAISNLSVGNTSGGLGTPSKEFKVEKFEDILSRNVTKSLPGCTARQQLTLNSNGSLADLLKRMCNSLVNELYFEEVRDDAGRAWPTVVLMPRPIQTPFFDDLFKTKVDPVADTKGTTNITHVVKKGENLTRLAKKYNTTISKLMSLNPSIKNKDLILTGATLVVGEEKPTQASPTTVNSNVKDALNGAYKSLQDWSRENFVEISPAEIKYENLGKDDHSRFNLFWLTVSNTFEHAFSAWSVSGKGLKGQLANPTLIKESINRHGLKRFEQMLEFCFPMGANNKPLTGILPDLVMYQAFMSQLYDMHFANHLYDAGTIECTGVLEAELGKALVIAKNPESSESKPKVYLIEGYEHNWVFPQGWTTIFTVTHGQFQVGQGQKNIFIDIAGDSGQKDTLIDSAYLTKVEATR